MLTAYAWFSVGMAVTAFMTTTTTFGIFRFVTGLGMGALIATTGVPLGSLLGSFIAIVLLDSIGWRGLFLIGALPLVTLLPLAFWKLPESVPWLVAKGKIDRAGRCPSEPVCPCRRVFRSRRRRPRRWGSRACSAAVSGSRR